MRLNYPFAILAALLSINVPASETEPAVGDDSETVKTQSPDLALTVTEYRRVPREYRLDGVVEAINRTTVSAQTQGQVQEILFDVDNYVAKGTVVASLKDTEHRARMGQAVADMKSADAQLEQAREEHSRVQGLYAKKNVSDSAMDQATVDLASTEASLEAATARLEQAQEQLEYTQIRAPYSGIVTQRHIELGELVSPGAPVMSGISLEELRVSVDVPQSVIPSVRKGGTARIYLPDGQVFETDAITIFPFADMGSNTFKVRVDLLSGTGGLFPGMFVKTGFVVGEKTELTVPKAAVVYRSEVTGVYVVSDGGHVHFRQVRLGRALDGNNVVLAGLTEGEQVALDPIAAGVVLKSQAPARHVTEADNG